MLSDPPGEPAGAITSGSTSRRDDDQECRDWTQWDERTNDRPHHPSPSTAHWRTPLGSWPAVVPPPLCPCLTDEPSNGIGEEQDNYGAECNRHHDEQRLSWARWKTVHREIPLFCRRRVGVSGSRSLYVPYAASYQRQSSTVKNTSSRRFFEWGLRRIAENAFVGSRTTAQRVGPCRWTRTTGQWGLARIAGSDFSRRLGQRYRDGNSWPRHPWRRCNAQARVRATEFDRRGRFPASSSSVISAGGQATLRWCTTSLRRSTIPIETTSMGLSPMATTTVHDSTQVGTPSMASPPSGTSLGSFWARDVCLVLPAFSAVRD